jgi:hypothetical protein
MARDVCFYRRHYLKPVIIRALVILICTDRCLLLEDLKAIKATKAVEERNLPEEPEDAEILEVQEIDGLISDHEESNNEDDNHEYSREYIPARGYSNDYDEFSLRQVGGRDDCLPDLGSIGLDHTRL